MANFLGEYMSEIALVLAAIGGGVLLIRRLVKAEIDELTRSINRLLREEKARELEQKFRGFDGHDD
jgi:hypothetical protein